MISLKKEMLTDTGKSFLDATRFNLIIHPGTNGNTREWPLTYVEKLITILDEKKFNIIITGSLHEQEKLAHLIQTCPKAKNAVGKLSLKEFVALISHADGLLANSTGPLHIAGAFNIHTLGLFPADAGKDPGRWQALGSHSEFIVAKNETAEAMQTISVEQVKEKIQTWLS
jgi:ADP-heptose:LPS heptosyltransferase